MTDATSPAPAPAPTTAPAPPTVFDETALEVARPYADALINAAGKAGSVDEVLDELDAILAFLTSKYPRFLDMMGSPLRSEAEKDRIIVEAFEGRALPTSVNFLRVLNRHGRVELLGTILRTAREAWDRRQGRHRVTVRSAVPLSDDQTAAMRERLAKAVGGTPVLTLKVDPSLIGGLVVQVGDDVYDASVRNHLGQLRQRLIEGKTHEIQSRRDHFSYSE
jgi:F-type H+-transporting ATPase subunit delta